MVEAASVVFLLAETPVHAGAGGAEAAIDLPIQRSAQTGWPILNDSTVRGGLRRTCKDKKQADEWFGTEEGDDRHPGWITTPDAELLLFPVAAAKGLVAYVTCLPAIQYFLRKVKMFEHAIANEAAKQALKSLETWAKGAGSGPSASSRAWVANAPEVTWQKNQQRFIVLEPDSFEVEGDGKAEGLAEWIVTNALPCQSESSSMSASTGSGGGSSSCSYWQTWVKPRVVVLHPEAFDHYVRTKTDIRTRVRISEGRAADTGLWTEENLPPDTVLYTVLTGYNWTLGSRDEKPGEAKRILGEMRTHVGLATKRPVIQLGGDQNLGRGLLRLRELGS